MAVIDELVVRIGSDVKGALAGIASVDTAMSRMDNTVSRSADKIRVSTAKIAKSFALVGAAATAAMAGLGVVMGKQSGDMESYMTTLTQLYGAQDMAAEKMRWLLDFAKRTPFELPGLIEATVKLKAYGIEAEDVLKGLGDTASAMGKPINMAVEALADAQTGEFERLKEFGVKAIQVTNANAVSLGVGMEAVGQTVLASTDKYGQQRIDIIDRNNREVITSTLMSIWNSKYAGGMAMQATTLKGMVSNIKDSMFQASLAIMGFDATIGTFRPDSLFVKIKTAVDGVLSYINKIDFNSVATKIEVTVNNIIAFSRRMASELAPTFENIKVIFISLAGIAGDLFEAFAGGESGTATLTGAINMLTGALAAVFSWIDRHPTVTKLVATLVLAATAFSYILPIVVSVTAAVSGLIAFVGTLSAAFTGAATVTAGLSAVIALLGGPITLVIGAVALLAAAWATNFLGIRDITHNVLSWMEDRFYDLVNFIGPLLTSLINQYIKAFNYLVPYLNKAGLELNTIAEMQFTALEKTIANTADNIEISSVDIGNSMNNVELDIVNAANNSANSIKQLGDVIKSSSEEYGAAMAYAGVTREDLAKRTEMISKGVIRPAEMVGAIPTKGETMDPTLKVVDEQKTTNQKLDKLNNLDTLSEISGKLDSLKIEVNNYVTNNKQPIMPGFAGGAVSDTSLVGNTKAAGQNRIALPIGTSPVPKYVSLFR